MKIKKVSRVNPVAKYSRNKTGAGKHKSVKDYTRKIKHKHQEEESIANKIDRLILLERMQENTNSGSNWFMYEEEIQIKDELGEHDLDG